MDIKWANDKNMSYIVGESWWVQKAKSFKNNLVECKESKVWNLSQVFPTFKRLSYRDAITDIIYLYYFVKPIDRLRQKFPKHCFKFYPNGQT